MSSITSSHRHGDVANCRAKRGKSETLAETTNVPSINPCRAQETPLRRAGRASGYQQGPVGIISPGGRFGRMPSPLTDLSYPWCPPVTSLPRLGALRGRPSPSPEVRVGPSHPRFQRKPSKLRPYSMQARHCIEANFPRREKPCLRV